MIIKHSEQTTRRTDRSKNLVGFMVGQVNYAVSIFDVREIINPLAVTEMPHSPEVVVGVTEHRGEVVPIVDLRRRFGLPPIETTRRSKWIIVELEGRAVGLAVDAVTEVFGASESEQREPPRLGSGDAARGIAQVFAYGTSLVFVIDIERVAAPAAEIDVADVDMLAAASQLPPPSSSSSSKSPKSQGRKRGPR